MDSVSSLYCTQGAFLFPSSAPCHQQVQSPPDRQQYPTPWLDQIEDKHQLSLQLPNKILTSCRMKQNQPLPLPSLSPPRTVMFHHSSASGLQQRLLFASDANFFPASVKLLSRHHLRKNFLLP